MHTSQVMKIYDFISYRKFPTGRISCDRNKHDIISMKNVNLRKTYIPFAVNKHDISNMCRIIIWENCHLQENCRKAIAHLLKAGTTFQVILLVKPENLTICLITDRHTAITFLKMEAKHENCTKVQYRYERF